MAGFYAFSLFILLVCWQKQLCLSEDTIFNKFGLNTTPMEIADNIWSEIKEKGDLSKLKTLSEINFVNYLSIRLNRHAPIIYYEPQDLENIYKLMYMTEFQEPFEFIDELFGDQIEYLENNTVVEKIVDFKDIILALLSNGSSNYIDKRIYQVYNKLIDEKENVLDLIDRYLNKGYVINCLIEEVKQQSLQQFYRTFSTIIKFFQVKYLIEKKTLYDMVEKYSATGIVKAIEEQKLDEEDFTKYLGVEVNNGTRKIVACKLESGDKYHECVKNITLSILKPTVSRSYENIKFMDTKIREAIKLKMKTTSREVWKCGTDMSEGETHIKLDNLFQGYFTSSSNNDKCSDSNKTVPCHFTRRCTGTLHNCKPIDLTHNDDYLRICTADKNSNYRYEYIEYGDPQDPKSYGEKKNCNFNSNMTKPISYCICEESRPDSDRYVSLVPAMAKENQVVTGARLIKINHTLYIQIQEGELGPDATIKNNTASWTPVKTVEPTKENIDNKLTHEIQWNSGRGVYVTERSYAPLDVAVVGLGFGETPEKDIFLQVYGRSFNFATGKLSQDVVPFVFDVDRKHGKRLDLSNLDDPSGVDDIDIPVPTDQFIDFTTTSLERDIGQNTIPYIDIQELTTDELTPISDAEIYYRKSEGYGGYLGLKLHTYNIEPYFQVKNVGN